ncbi:MAG: phosphotransferase [Actinomycetales bacterium]|nr:phosphotransferase [Actinomycetales bacterium]
MNIPEEQPLEGGNASGAVVRVGATVRKPWGPATPAVHELMRTVAAAGIDVPTPLGRDEQGRQILEYVPGKLAMDSPVLTPPQLAEVGGLVRTIHDACEGFTPSARTDWEALLPVPEGDPDLLCHGDLAPWNLVLGKRWVFIDWDGAGPSTRLWDLAYSTQAFTVNDPGERLEHSSARLRAFVDGYGADDALRARLPEAMAQRAEAMHDLLRRSHAEGRDPWGSMFVQGHGAHWRGVADHVAAHREVWARALATSR